MRCYGEGSLEAVSEVLDVCNAVIPEEISSKFEDLWKELVKYNFDLVVLCEKEAEFSTYLEDNKECMDSRKRLLKFKSEVNNLFKKKDLDYYKLRKLSSKIVFLEDKLGNDYKVVWEGYVNKASDLKIWVKKVDQDLGDLKQNLDEIDFRNGCSRLEDLDFEEKHWKMIDKISHLGDDDKKEMKRWLPIYLNLKMSFYKNVYEMAGMAVDAYKKGKPALLFDNFRGTPNNASVAFNEDLGVKYRAMYYLGDSLMLPKLYPSKSDKRALFISKSFDKGNVYGIFNILQSDNLLLYLTLGDDGVVSSSLIKKNDRYSNCLAMGKMLRFLETNEKLSFDGILESSYEGKERLIATDGLYYAGRYLNLVRKEEDKQKNQGIMGMQDYVKKLIIFNNR